jgi:integrase
MTRPKSPPRSERRSFGRLRQFRSGRWKASYTHDGRLYEAPHTYADKIDAEAWLIDRRREIDRDLWSPPATTQQKKAKRKADITFGDYAKQWADTRTVKGRPLRPRSRAHYEKLIDNQLSLFFSRPVRSITMEMVDKWYTTTATDTPTMRAHAYSLLRTILESARTRDKLIDHNPCAVVGGGSTERKIKPRPATLEQLDVIVTDMPDQLQLMTLLAAWCALRFGELVELRRKDIDLKDNVVKIRRGAVRLKGEWVEGDPKSDAGRRDVAIPPHIIPAVKRHMTEHVDAQQNALLFPAKSGEHLQPSTLYRHFYRARAKAKRTDLRFHDLRHTGAVMAAQTGATLAELMDRLGHSTHQAALRYQHAAQGRDKAIAAAMSKMVK